MTPERVSKLRRATGGALLLMLGVAGFPAEATDTDVAGPGLAPCASWLSSPENQRDGTSWLLGFWSGMNRAKSYKVALGNSAVLDLMLNEMRTICNAKPSLVLPTAAASVFERAQMGTFDQPPSNFSPPNK